MTPRKIVCSFSGGRTSAMMSKLIRDFLPTAEVIFIFANSGEEDEKTLEFVNRCDEAFGLDLIWVEALVNPIKGQGTTFQERRYETASRNSEPFEQAIAKYGIPNKNYPFCTRELKLRPIETFVKSQGWTDHQTAIGIRSDEIDRISVNAAANRIIYPLVKLGITKQDVIEFWKGQAFDLQVPEHRGNCKTCWKKSFRKLMTLASETPSDFDFFRRMEEEHSFTGPGNFNGLPRRFFRSRKTTNEIIADAQRPFEKFTDPNYIPDPELDQLGDCTDSCDIYSGQEWDL